MLNPTILVLEPTPCLAPAIFTELQIRSQRNGTSTQRDFLSVTCRKRLDTTVCHSVTQKQLMQQLQVLTADIAAIVLDLNEQPREGLVVLQLLNTLPAAPKIIAVGNNRTLSILGVLLEAGCSALLTELPYDIPIVNWYERVVANAGTGTLCY